MKKCKSVVLQHVVHKFGFHVKTVTLFDYALEINIYGQPIEHGFQVMDSTS